MLFSVGNGSTYLFGASAASTRGSANLLIRKKTQFKRKSTSLLLSCVTLVCGNRYKVIVLVLVWSVWSWSDLRFWFCWLCFVFLSIPCPLLLFLLFFCILLVSFKEPLLLVVQSSESDSDRPRKNRKRSRKDETRDEVWFWLWSSYLFHFVNGPLSLVVQSSESDSFRLRKKRKKSHRRRFWFWLWYCVFLNVWCEVNYFAFVCDPLIFSFRSWARFVGCASSETKSEVSSLDRVTPGRPTRGTTGSIAKMYFKESCGDDDYFAKGRVYLQKEGVSWNLPFFIS